MSQVRRGFERTIISRVIVFCDFDRVFRVSKGLQLVERFVIAMRQNKPSLGRLLNREFDRNKTAESAQFRDFARRIRHW